MDGWIKLHRQIVRSSKFADPDILRLWILCLTKASHRGGTVLVEKQEVTLQPGQFVTGRYSLQQEYNEQLSPRKKVKDTTLWSWLKRLEKWGDLDINSTNKFSVITVLKWSEYQESLTTESQQIDNKTTAESQQTDTNKNVKNEKNDKKNVYGQHVELTEDEYNRLCTEWGEDEVARFIDDANYYFSQQPAKKKKYSNHNLMLRRWKRMDLEKGIKRRVQKKKEDVMSIEEWRAHEKRRAEEAAKRVAEI